MAQITDPQVIDFVNVYVRPFAEVLRNNKVKGDDMTAKWDAIIAPLVAVNGAADTIEDGREAEGVSRLTLGDIQAFIAVVKALGDGLEDPGATPPVHNMPIIRKPTVRPLAV